MRPEKRTEPVGAAGVLAFALALVAAGSLLACAWSVPADPGLNARLRARPAPELDGTSTVRPDGLADPEAEAIYRQRCGRCHAPWPTTHVTAAAWPVYVRRYGPRAGLFGAERERVLRWLQANAR